jgi:hypothetical protein
MRPILSCVRIFRNGRFYWLFIITLWNCVRECVNQQIPPILHSFSAAGPSQAREKPPSIPDLDVFWP